MFCFYMTIYGINLVSLSTSLKVLKMTHLLIRYIIVFTEYFVEGKLIETRAN